MKRFLKVFIPIMLMSGASYASIHYPDLFVQFCGAGNGSL